MLNVFLQVFIQRLAKFIAFSNNKIYIQNIKGSFGYVAKSQDKSYLHHFYNWYTCHCIEGYIGDGLQSWCQFCL